MKKGKHNGIIGFWKFMFCMMVLLLHCSPNAKLKIFKQGYLGVEFFFIVSGYLMASNTLKQKENKEIGKKHGYIFGKK